MFRKIDHSRTADAVVHQLEELILNGVLRPGDRLPPERDLALELDVSRPVLRHALKDLEDRGLVASRQGGGTYVADVIGPIFSDPVVSLIERHPSAASDYLEFRRDIEATAAGYAAERATEADHKILASLVQRMEAAYQANDRDLEAELDIEFHQAIGEAAHNVILMHALRSCYRLLANGVVVSRQRLYDQREARADLLAQHKNIAAGILAGSAQDARDASRKHIDYVQSALAAAEQSASRQSLANMRRLHRDPASAKPRRRSGSVS